MPLLQQAHMHFSNDDREVPYNYQDVTYYVPSDLACAGYRLALV